MPSPPPIVPPPQRPYELPSPVPIPVRTAGLSGQRPAWPLSPLNQEPGARKAAASRPPAREGDIRAALSGAATRIRGSREHPQLLGRQRTQLHRRRSSKLTPDASRMFRKLGVVEIDLTSREIVRQAIEFLRNAPQCLLHVRLDGNVRQSPGVAGLCAIIG